MKFADLVKPNTKKLNVWLDLSTYCNASCPQCHRTDKNGLGKVEWLPLIKWSLEDFVRQFPPGSIDEVTMFEICGTWGDPIMSKDIGKIVKYVMDNSQAEVHINTNGGMRTPAWWEDLGNYCGKRLTVYFDVDGTTNEMHQKYRRGVDLQTVLDNMEALSSTEANTKAFTILFKHNQDYIKDIEDMCVMYGAESVHIIKSDRFMTTNKFAFINENGKEDVLEAITKNLNHKIKNPWINAATDNAKNRRNLDKMTNNKLTSQQDENSGYER
tara:strand:- start:832 stop:1641 length:810 start_codon:yes stop_codon:yes gene_type:complete